MAGAIFAGYFWFQAQNFYISLQVGVSNYNAIYGSFATLPLFLVWIYFGWIFILLGAQIAYAYQNKNTFRLIAAKAQPSLRLAVAYDLLGYVRECFHAEKSATAPDFSVDYPMHNKTLVDETIENLARKLVETVPESLRSVGEELESNFRSVLRASLAKLDLVTREEFEVQEAVLARTREKLEALEAKLDVLEQDGK